MNIKGGRRGSLATALVVGALTVGAGAASPAPALADTVREFRCISNSYGWRYCRTMDFSIQNCRVVGIRNLDSGNNRWIKVQIRKWGESSPRWQSKAIRPGQATNGFVAGRDRFTPRIFVDSDGLTRTAMTVRIRFRC